MSESADELALPVRHAPSPGIVVPVCLGIYVLFACLAFWPVLPFAGNRLPFSGYGDPGQFTWFLAWVPYAIEHGLDPFRTNYLDYPGGVDLANNTLAPLLGVLGWPVTATLGPIAAFNVLLRLAFAASAASMYLVLRTWCRTTIAFFGGLLYGFGPYLVSQGHAAAHLDLSFVPFPPIIMWCLYELVVTRSRRPSAMGVLLGLCVGGQVLIDPELAALLGLVCVLGLVGLGVIERQDLMGFFRPLARAIPVFVLVFLVLTGAMFWSMLFGTGHLIGPVQATQILQSYHADLLGPIVPTSNQLIAPTHLAATAARFVAGNFTENSAYLGIPAVASLFFLLAYRRRDKLVVLAGLAGIVAFVLSLGPRLSIDGHQYDIALPEALLSHVSLFDSIVPARFSLDVALFSVIALGVGAERVLRASSTKRLLAPHPIAPHRIAVPLAGLLVLLAVVPSLPFSTTNLAWPSDTTATLDAIAPGSVVLTYPFTVYPWTEAMAWQAQDAMRFRLIGAYATVEGPASTGVAVPSLLQPAFVQEYLVQAQDGQSRLYPPPTPGQNPSEELCRFIANYGVTAVTWLNVGAAPGPVEQLFSAALGQPARKSADGQLAVWVVAPGSCRVSP